MKKLIVALDYAEINQALTLVDQLDPQSCALKVGLEMFTLFGADFVRQLIARQFNVFLDLKFHDIPHTVARACSAAADLGVWMLNVHALGGIEMLQAASRAVDSYGKQRPLLIAVTILTSMNDASLSTIGIKNTLEQEVGLLATIASNAILDGVVCAAHEVPLVKDICGATFLTVTPGIRLLETSQDDQKRIMTPEKALSFGSDYLVVGRPITQSVNPKAVVAEILRYVG